MTSKRNGDINVSINLNVILNISYTLVASVIHVYTCTT